MPNSAPNTTASTQRPGNAGDVVPVSPGDVDLMATGKAVDANGDGVADTADVVYDIDGDGQPDALSGRAVREFAGQKWAHLGPAERPKDYAPSAEEVIRTTSEYHLGPVVKWWKWATALFTGGGLGGGVVIGLLIGWSTPQVVTITRDVIQSPSVTPGRPGVGVNHSRDLLIEWSQGPTWKRLRDAEQEKARRAVEADR